MKSSLYTNAILTAIALLLVFHAFVKAPVPTVHADPLRWSHYRAVVMEPGDKEVPRGGLEAGSVVLTFGQRLNEAAQGDRLLALVPIDEPGGDLLAVFASETDK